MNEADFPVYRALRHEVEDTSGDADAALCGARRVLPIATIRDEEPAGEELALEKAGSLSARQSRVAAMLAGGMTVREAAAITGLHRGTIFRWRQSSPAFRKEQQRCSAEAASELSAIARRLIVKATGYIDRLMEEDGSRDDWAARILRNRRLWDVALRASEETDAHA